MPRPVHLYLDWDGTLTEKDTLALVAGVGYKKHSNCSSIPEWSFFGQAWLKDYSTHAEAYTPRAEARCTLEQEASWLNSLVNLEEASLTRVKASGLFDGVTSSDVVKSARNHILDGDLRLRKGWTDLFEHILQSQPRGKIGLISVNWSRHFIRGSLEAGLAEAKSDHAKALLDYVQRQMTIDANEVYGNDEQAEGVRTSGDKLRCLQKQIARHESSEKHSLNIYIGDSTTDLECLLAEDIDVAICVRDEPMSSTQRDLAQTLERLNIKVLPAAASQDQHPGQKPVFFAQDFVQVLHLIQSLTAKDDT